MLINLNAYTLTIVMAVERTYIYNGDLYNLYKIGNVLALSMPNVK